MRWKNKIPLWPWLVALACLFVLAVAAPWGWQHASRRSAVGYAEQLPTRPVPSPLVDRKCDPSPDARVAARSVPLTCFARYPTGV